MIRHREPVRQMLVELHQHMTYEQIARRAGVHVRTVLHIAAGRTLDPRYSLGKQIERMHGEYCVTEISAAAPVE